MNADDIGAEAESYLRSVALLAAYGEDPHAAARARARLARERENAAAAEHGSADAEREQRRKTRAADRRARLLAPFRFCRCPEHGIDPCPDDCPTLHDWLRCAGIDPRWAGLDAEADR